MKEKVEILKMYAPKLLAPKSEDADDGPNRRPLVDAARHTDIKQSVKKIVKDIAKALCEYSKNKQRGFDSKEFNQKL